MGFSIFNNTERIRELEVIGLLIGGTEDELSDNIKAWLVEKIYQIKSDYIQHERGVNYFGKNPKPFKVTVTPNLLVSTTNRDTADTSTIGARIRQLRKERMLTHAELAESVGVQPTLVTIWENNTIEPRANHIIPLANALKCDPMWLLTGNPADVKAASPAEPAPVNVMKDVDMANIGVRIRNHRKEMGMTTEDLADAVDVSDTLIAEWETGKAIPSSFYINSLADALDTSIAWLMTGKHTTA
ncbi:helix-turn-helix domain-containing protein [Salmonella enterica subsp. enterica serovar Kokomlemle]